jgi:putative transposase
MPHHVTQRGNRRADVFFDPRDREQYLLLRRYAHRYGLRIWACCLMTNHVHFATVPVGQDSLGRGFRDTHQAYASWLNRRMRKSGHLWQGRYASSVLDDPHLWACVRYVARNPVRAGLVERAEEPAWSSAAAHCGHRADPLWSPVEMPWAAEDWSAHLQTDDEEMVEAIRRQTLTSRPCGSQDFVAPLEDALGRVLHPQKPGPKPKAPTREVKMRVSVPNGRQECVTKLPGAL